MAGSSSSVKHAFVIGPMFREGEDSNGIAYTDQIWNITKALNAIGAELKASHGVELVTNAPDLRVQDIQDISSFALGQIDRCDFAVADISVRSPSVMYEIAVLHSLGTPVLLIDRNPVKIEDAVYYLKGLTVRGVDSFTIENIRERLEAPVRALCGIQPTLGEDYRLNPVTAYYDNMPLADTRAITGIATSFFSNYLRFMLHPSGPLRGDHTLNQIIIIEPNELRDNFGASVKSRMKDAFGDRLQELKETTSVFSRPFFYFRVDGAAIEYPTPLDSLVFSPQYRKTRDRLTKFDPDGKGAEAFAIFEKDMIRAFKRTVNDLCRMNFDTIEPPQYMEIEEFFSKADQIGR